MPNRQTPTNPVFSIVFSKGTADQHRLPLSHVLESLTEIAKDDPGSRDSGTEG